MILSVPFISNDAVVLGLLCAILAGIFYTSSLPGWSRFYRIVPALLLCYFIPAVFSSLGVISAESSNLYFVASRYLLPTSLVLLCLSIDMKGVLNLGPKALIMFLTATAGIILGGPLAILIVKSFAPEVFLVEEESRAIWRGLATVAGSWIGGGANQTAMKEIYEVNDTFFGAMILVDVFVANFWMAFLLVGAGMASKLDKFLKADARAIDELKSKMENFSASVKKIPTTTDLFILLAVGFGATAIAHFASDLISPVMAEMIDVKSYLSSLRSPFFWLVVITTLLGVGMSFTPARKLEGAGASRIGSVFIYVLVATIGMKMNLRELVENWEVLKWLLLLGLIWMAIHVLLLLGMAKLIRAPFFFVAVGSQANVGGAASAPIVASAFHPLLAPVGVLLAVLGYALGTVGAIICALLMAGASG